MQRTNKFIDGLRNMVRRRANNGDQWVGSKLWGGYSSSSTRYKVTRTSTGYELLVGCRWGVKDGVTHAVPLARIALADDCTPVSFDATHAGSYVYSVCNAVLHAAWNNYQQTRSPHPHNYGTQYIAVERVKTPRYVFVDPTHPIATNSRAGRSAKHVRVLTVNRDTRFRSVLHSPRLSEALVCEGKWVRIHDDRIEHLDPIALPVARCDFKLARSNAKVLREVEDTTHALLKVTGVSLRTLKYETREDPTQVKTNADVQAAIDSRGGDIAPTELAPVMHLRMANNADAERLGLPPRFVLDEHGQPSKWTRTYIPAIRRPTPVRMEQQAVIVNTLEELHAYAESFKRGA